MSAHKHLSGSIVVFALALLAIPLHSQIPTGEITGTVTDSSGGVLSNATVSVTNTATNARRTATTNESGNYDFSALPPGTYSLRIEMQGFNAEVRDNIELRVAQVARLDSSLKLGSVSETVEVLGGAPVLETENASVGTVIENKRIIELPLNGRNYLSLTALTPGVSTSTPVNQVATSREGGTRGSFTVSAGGQRAYFNHYSLDGADNTDPNFNAYVFLLSIDALQEFKVETGVFPAEYGHNLAQVNATTRGGTNTFHGSLFEFLRNSAISAKNYFDNPALPIPPFKRNQFGGTVGGPIIRNKLFFFFDYEGLRERKGITKVGTVPSANWRAGNFQGSTTIYDPNSRVYNYDANGTPVSVVSSTPFADNVIPVSRMSPVAVASVARFVPLPNIGGIQSNAANNFVNALSQPTDNDQQSVRVDYLQSTSINWLFRYAHSAETQLVPGVYPGLGEYTISNAHQGVLGNTWLFGATRVNDFKLSINYLGNIQPTLSSCKVNLVKELGVPNFPTDFCFNWGAPGIGFGISDGGGTWADWEGFGSATDGFSWIHGKHTYKFGGEVGRFRLNGINGTYNSGAYTASGTYTTSGLPGVTVAQANTAADTLLGLFSTSTGTFGPQIFNIRWTYFAAYAEDSWKVTPKLTINYGLRWENQKPYTDTNNNNINVDFAWDNSIRPTLVRPGGGDPLRGNPQYVPLTSVLPLISRSGDAVYNNDPWNFGPRLGIAYSPNSKTVVRAGAGLFFAHEIHNGFIEGARNPPFSRVTQNNANAVFPNLTWDNAFPAPLVPSFLSAIERNEPTTRSLQWTMAVQRQIGQNSSLQLTYLGTAGMYLPRFTTYNSAPPGPGTQSLRYPYPQLQGTVQVLMPSAHSSYHALLGRFEQRFTHGFTVLSSFSYSKSIDNDSSLRKITLDGDTRNPLTPWDIRGRSAFDFTRRWASSFLYELPLGKGKRLLGNSSALADRIVGGWQVSGIFTMQDGLPITAGCNNFATFQNGGQQLDGAFCYPDAVAGVNPNLPQGQQDPKHWYNLAAFVNQKPYSFGNGGRNTIVGPGIISLDASLVKTFKLTETHNLQFRAEAFNVGNHPLWGYPGTTVGSPTAGVISSTIIDSREYQFGLRYFF